MSVGIERYMNSAAARRLIVAFDSGTQPITADTTLTLLPPYKRFTIADKRARSRRIRPEHPAGRLDPIEPRPHRLKECERQRGTGRETSGKPARGRQRLGASPATDRALEKSRTRAAERLVEVAERLKCAEQAVAETKKLQGVTTRPCRHLDLTTRSGAEGRYVFGSAADGGNP